MIKIRGETQLATLLGTTRTPSIPQENSRPSPDGQSAIWSHNLASPTPTSSTSSSVPGRSFSHRRRRSSAANPPQTLNLDGASTADSDISPSRSAPRTLPPIPGTPNMPMSLSRSPSPQPGGGWASPGLSTPAFANVSGRSSPHKKYGSLNGNGPSVTWESAKAKTDGVNGYPSFSTQNNGFFNRHYRSLSNSLPQFNMGSDRSYAEKEKLGRGRWTPRDGSRLGRLRAAAGRVSRKVKLRLLVVMAFIMMFILFYSTRKLYTPESLVSANKSSRTLLVAENKVHRRRQEIRNYIGGKSRRRSNGMEGS